MSARIDLAGGWTDTPPITFGHANGVVNMAIKVGGEKPVKCTVTKVFHSEKEALILTSVQTEREKLTIESIPGLKMFSADPDRFGSLILSSIQATGLITTGMTTLRQLFDALFPHEHVMEVHVATSSLLPQGSGLGTSSILSACFLCSLAKIMNKEIDRQTIAATVLQAEQILTTGGGWQDQVGALYPGIKYSSYENGSLNVDVLHITDQLQQEIEQRLVLVYTGKTRLAANVLHKVVYKFVVGRSEFIQHIVDIANTATLVRNALLSNKFPVKESSRYNALKSTMAENAFPPDVKCLIEDLQSRNIIEADLMTNKEFTEFYSGKPKGKFLFDEKAKTVVHLGKPPRTTSFTTFLISVFLPQGYPYTVTSDYVSYQIWDTVQAFASSLVGALATEAVLEGVGVGSGQASVLAATIVWLLKDGCGMVGRIVFAWLQGSRLDIDCKKWRLIADILNDFAFLIDLLAPAAGEWFICFAIGSSLLRSFVGVAGGATRAAIIQHQARRHNLADVAAKDGSQETLVNLSALLASLILIPTVHGKKSIVWCFYVFFTAIHLYANYKAVRTLHFDILNERTLALSVSQFVKNNTVPSIVQANHTEPLFGNVNGRRHFGCKVSSAVPSSILSEKYFLRYDYKSHEGWLALATSTTYSDQLRFAFDLEYFSLRHRLPSDIEYENFKGLMTKEHWRLDVNHLGYDEWRFNVEL
ncbi:hypothetical protein QR680_000033 [Steinernema hermaphroditum]|uniref:GHMP kinase N-terminal domain-containing protein n=1 Tax=Steinernema hermaphroditum TaxID=289476 RepID=A0AA39LDD4_9BILA|nr:hypothetical protein QR680_000033 [Steinernema hermaphroditum]